jgi:hypothetical protein
LAEGWDGVGLRTTGSPAELQRYPYYAKCPNRNCYFNRCAKSMHDALDLLDNHECPYVNGNTTLGWSIVATLVERLWELADKSYDELKEQEKNWVDEETSPRVSARARGELNAYCKSIAIFMVPHFRTAKEVAAELAKRYEARQKEEEYETPGLGSLRTLPPPDSLPKYQDLKSKKPNLKATTNPIPNPPTEDMHPTRKTRYNTLKHDEWEAVRKLGKDNGMFTAEKLAKMYKCSVEEIERAWNF